jgi:hypothetical protein
MYKHMRKINAQHIFHIPSHPWCMPCNGGAAGASTHQ